MSFPRLEVERPARSLRDLDPTPQWIQQLPTFLGWGMIWLATIVGAYGFRAMQDFHFAIHAVEQSEQAERDTAAADSLTAGCLSIESANRLLREAELAGALLTNRRLLQSWVLQITNPRTDYVAEQD